MDTIKTISIYLNGDDDMVSAIEEVTRLIKEGYTSGFSPNWNITEQETPKI